ncbi:MAG TPA: Ig-like domain-containing protein, partial [Anaerolineae bacterium]
QYRAACLEQIVPAPFAYLITDILSDNNARAPGFGINSILKLSRPAAVKTGTTSDWKDNWTLGYTPDYVVGVWVGNADNKEMEHISGITGAAPIWAQVMENIHKNAPVHPFVEPPGMTRISVCAGSGLLPTQYCPTVVRDLFVKGNEPRDPDNVYKPFRIFRANGKLATAFDPPEQVDTVVFPLYPPEVQDWARENNIPQPPTEFDTTFAASAAGGALAILSPVPYSYVKGNVEVKGNVKLGDIDRWRVAFGEGLDPTQWTEIGSGGGQVDNGRLADWNVSGLKAGLYTVQLTAIDRGGGPHSATAQVTVDNNPPRVDIINPDNGDKFVMEKDEWISVDVRAVDDFSMGKVEFYFDDHKISTTTVSPFGFRWTISMNDPLSNTLRAALDSPNPSREVPLTTQFTFTRTESYDGKEYKEGDTITKTLTAPVVKRKRAASLDYTNGYSALLDLNNPATAAFTETHTIWVRAFDAAGNSADSKKLKFFVSHKPPDEKKPTGLEWRRDEFSMFDGPSRVRAQRVNLLKV